MDATEPVQPRFEGAGYVSELIRSIVDRCPRRSPASADERRAQEILKSEFDAVGLNTGWHRFRFNVSLYADMALHFGLAVVGTAISGIFAPAGAVLHVLAAGSWAAQSTRKHHVLRRLLPHRQSQNLIATMPASRNPNRRIVFMSHADAAFTGLVFSPRMVRSQTNAPGFMKRSLAMATLATALVAFVELARYILAPDSVWFRIVEWILTVPALLTFVLNMDVVVRNKIVPGANDNLSGTAALPVLAKRLAPDKPPDVELVFCVTGCEEAGLGGAMALARDMGSTWSRDNTVIIGLDGLTNGQLKYASAEGEIFTLRSPEWLNSILDDVARSRPDEPAFRDVGSFEIPVGGTDVAAFLARGFSGVCLVAIDPESGGPRHYHTVNDTPDNLDLAALMKSIDFVESGARVLMRLPSFPAPGRN